MFFSVKKDRTRGHEVKLVKDQCVCGAFGVFGVCCVYGVCILMLPS